MANNLQTGGAQPKKQTRFAPLFCNRWFTGLWTQRSPLRDAATPFLYEKFYSGSRIESMIDGLNVEVTSSLTVARRPGLSVYNSKSFPPVDSFYEFKQFSSNTEKITVVADTATTIYDATGPSTKTTILTKGAGAGQAYFQSVGNVLYIGDGVEQNKYLSNGPTFVTQNWGISINTISGISVGGNAVAGSGADGGGAFNVWSNPGNVSSATSYATTSVGTKTNQLLATNFGFTLLASSVVVGYQVTFDYTATTQGGPGTFTAQLIYAGSIPIGSSKSITVPASSTVSGTAVLGSSSDTWGASVAPVTINSSGFGVQIQAIDDPFGMTAGVRNVNLTVYIASAGPSVNPTGAGSFAAATGYQYVFSYGNSLTGGVSNTTPSSNTGAFAGKDHVNVVLTASTDSQVNQIRVFRTKDGGSTFFELPNSPFANSSATIQDSAADSTLQLLNLAPTGLNNSPPPSGLINLTYHLQRVFGSVGNTVYYSIGPSLTTLGNPNESWPPANFFIFPSLVIRMVPTPLGLLVFTVSDIFVISGQGTSSSPLFSAPFVPQIGLLNYHALDINGSTIYLFTNQSQVVTFDPSSGFAEIGFPIGDKLSAFTPSTVSVAWHAPSSTDKALYVADGISNWFRLNPVPAPETGSAWSPKANIIGGCQLVQSVEVSPGIHQLLVSSTATGPILKRDTTVYSDNGTSYNASFTLGNVVLALPGQIAELAFITTEAKSIGSRVSVSVLRDEISGPFTPLNYRVNDPPILPPSGSLLSDRWLFSATGEPALCRHLQIQFNWPSEAFANEILTYTIFGAYHQEA